MLDNNIEYFNIIKAATDDTLDYFDHAYISNLELVQSLKTELFELGIKIEETERTKELYSYRSENRRNLFSPNLSEETFSHAKSRILDEQLSDLYTAKNALLHKISTTEESLILLQDHLHMLQQSRDALTVLRLNSGDLSTEPDELIDSETTSSTSSETITNFNHSYNILMLHEYDKSNFADYLRTNIKQKLQNNQHKIEVLNWLLTSDIERARLTLKEILTSSNSALEDIDKLIESINQSIDQEQPIWMTIEHTISTYKSLHPNCIIESTTQCPDYEINIPPILTISLVTILKELFDNIFRHSNANKVISKIYISKHVIDVYINDNGVGISSDYLSTSNWHSGLHKIHELIYQLDGKISIEGDLISGTNIRFSFPILT